MTIAEPTDLLERAVVRWFIDALKARRTVTPDEVREHFTQEFVELASAEALAGGMTKMSVGLKVIEPVTVDADGAVRVPLSATGGYAPFRVRIGVEGDRLTYFDFGPAEIEGVAMRMQDANSLSADDRVAVHDVFDDAYRDGDHAYLDAQLATLGTIATAWSDSGLVGFALSDARVVDLPGLGTTIIRTAGLACVRDSEKRKGIGARLESMAMTGGDVPAAQHTVLTSRLAHPAGIHHLRKVPGLVPRVGHTASDWQRDVAAGVAQALGVAEFDRQTFVCKGSGRPVGENVIDVDVPDEERALFAAVDRSRGDTLLALWWTTPPAGWD